MKWVDTPLFVYRAVEGHPARPAIQEILKEGDWASHVLVLLETFQVLTRDYGVDRDRARDEIDRLVISPVHWEPIRPQLSSDLLELCVRYRIETSDAGLLCLAREDDGTLVSPDRRLLDAGEEETIAQKNPVSSDLRDEVALWEEEQLPEKGLSRILSAVSDWIGEQDPELAERMERETENYKTLP